MSKARDLADLLSTGGALADGQISVSEISDLTATAAELNVLDGITASVSDLNGVAGINSNVQTQLNLKSPLASPTFTGTATIPTATVTTLTLGGTSVTGIGTSASDLVQLNGSAQLPAVDGSLLTGISAGVNLAKSYYLAQV